MAKRERDVLTDVRNNYNFIQPNTSWGGYDIFPTNVKTNPSPDKPKTKTPYEGQEGGRNTQDKDYYDLATQGAVGTTLNGVLGTNKLGDSLKAPTGGGGGGVPVAPQFNYARYNSPYQGQIDALLKAIMNRDPFSYDYLSDPVYQSYRQQYEFQGDRARENAIGDYARNTGGLASSWATTAGQLAQNNYNAQLNGLIPELHDARYNKYLGEVQTDFNKLAQLQSLENDRYNRYADERDFAYRTWAGSKSGGSGGGGSRSSTKTSSDDYLEEMLRDFRNSGLSYEEYINKYNLNSKEINFLKPYKDLGGSGGGDSSFGNIDTSGTSSGGSSIWDYAKEDPNEAIRKRIIADLMQKGYYQL